MATTRNRLTDLRCGWRHASDDERRAFLRWIVSSEATAFIPAGGMPTAPWDLDGKLGPVRELVEIYEDVETDGEALFEAFARRAHELRILTARRPAAEEGVLPEHCIDTLSDDDRHGIGCPGCGAHGCEGECVDAEAPPDGPSL